MKWYPVHFRCCSLLMVLSLSGLAASRHCHHHHFWDLKTQMCRPCGKCPPNKIIHRWCGKHTDTVCRPFKLKEFNSFNQHDDESQYPSYEFESFSTENSSGRDSRKGYRRKTVGQQTEPIVEKDDGEYWKNLAFALIGVVSVLIFVATVVVLMACRKLHENSVVKRPEEEDDDDSGYVVIRAIRPPNMVYRQHLSLALSADFTPSSGATALLMPEDSTNSSLSQGQGARHLPLGQDLLRMKGAYKPKRRLLNYDADDVFESEDSAGSKTSRKVPLQPIPERSVSSDSENVNAPDEVPV